VRRPPKVEATFTDTAVAMLVKAVLDGRDELARDLAGQMQKHLTKARPRSDGEQTVQSAEDADYLSYE
jgi:hypothetical protein